VVGCVVLSVLASLVRIFVTLVVISKTVKVQFFKEIWHRYSASLPTIIFYRAMHFSANARSWDRMSSVCLSVCL